MKTEPKNYSKHRQVLTTTPQKLSVGMGPVVGMGEACGGSAEDWDAKSDSGESSQSGHAGRFSRKPRGGGGGSNGANGSPLLPPGLGVEGWCMEADAVDDSSGGGSGSDEGAGRFSRKRRAPFGSGEVMQDGAGEVQEGGV